MNKKLRKSNEDKKISGVCGGIAEHLNIDVTIVRLIWIVLFAVYGTGVLAYILASIVMPEAEE